MLLDVPLSICACDQAVVNDFDAVAGGPLRSISQLANAERFVRAAVLHDQVILRIEPLPAMLFGRIPPLRLSDGRVLVGQWFRGTSDYLRIAHGPFMGPLSREELDVPLSADLRNALQKLVGGEPDNEHYEQNYYYIQSLILTVKRGGSLVCAGPVGSLLETVASRYPHELFAGLDEEYRTFALHAEAGFDLVVPPMLAIVLQRASAQRNRIVDAVLELKQEWAEARMQLWEALTQLRAAKTTAEAVQLVSDLQVAGATFSRSPQCSSPLQVLWNLVDKSAEGAVEGWIAAGNPVLGAVAKTTWRAFQLAGAFGKRLFGRGGFSLGRHLRHALADVLPTRDLLTRFLTESERRALGL